MNRKTNMRIPLFCIVVVCLAASSAWAEDDVNQSLYEFLSLPGVAGQPASSADEFTNSSGAYVCKNAATRGTPHIVRYPFTLPDARRVFYVIVTGRRTSLAPPVTLNVVKSCMHWTEVNPTNTVLATTTPAPDVDGYFSSSLRLGDERPNNYDCKYWLEASIDISTKKCTDGLVDIQKIRIENWVADRIFRGSFSLNVPFGTP